MYLVFAWDYYHTHGGADDYKESAEDINKAIDLLRHYLESNDNAQLAKINNEELVAIGTVGKASFIDAIGAGGWLRELQKADKCLKCDAPIGRCYCPGGLYFNGKLLGAEIDMQARIRNAIESE